MLSFDYDTAQAHLTIEERAAHGESEVFEHDVRTGFHGFGTNFEEDWETVTRTIDNVPVRYFATVFYDGQPILRYELDCGDYAAYIDDLYDDDDDIECNDEDFFQWVWDQANVRTTWFGDYVLNGEDTDYFGPDKPCTVEDVARADSRWFDKVEVVR